MFTGIIQEVGTVARIRRASGLIRLTVDAPKTAAQARPLESVSVNGACLSVVARRGAALSFEMIAETQRLTTLGALRAGDRVNLEPSLRLSDRLNGHFVFGHVDGIGTITKRRQRPGEVVLEVAVSRRLRPCLVSKGPVALDGISLTVGQTLTASTFTVHLIPETLRHTTLAVRNRGDRLNVEFDYVAKLIAHMINYRPSRQ